jgi:hypothetical protein
VGRCNVILSGLGALAWYKTRRALRIAPRSLAESVEREVLLELGVEEPAVRPIILPRHLDRIRAGFEGRSALEVRSRINTRRHRAVPTRALILKDVLLFDGAFYCGMHKEDLFRGRGFKSTLFSQPAAEMDRAVWATSYAGARWFGHFLHDDLPLEVLASGLGPMVGHARPPYRHEAGWRKALDLPGPDLYGALRVRELTVLDDVGQTRGKRRRYAALRSRLAGRKGAADRVVLLRGSGGGEERRIQDEALLWERLRGEGFAILDTSVLSVDELLEKCAGASVVVSVEGSHAAPAFYLARAGATLVFLYPPSRVSSLMPQLSSFFGLRAAMFVGEPVDDSPFVFKVDPDELLRLIDQAVEEPRAALEAEHC